MTIKFDTKQLFDWLDEYQPPMWSAISNQKKAEVRKKGARAVWITYAVKRQTDRNNWNEFLKTGQTEERLVCHINQDKYVKRMWLNSWR